MKSMEKFRILKYVLVLLLSSYHMSGAVNAAGIKLETGHQIPSKCSLDTATLAVTCKCNNTEVHDILGILPSNTKRLTFELESDLHGHYPIPDINLCTISHLQDLQYLQLIGGYRQSTSNLIFDEDTFHNLTHVKELHINVVTRTLHLQLITKYMKNLQIYDISGTSRMGIKNVQKIISFMNISQLQRLILSNVQMPGIPGFSDSLNVGAFFKTTQPLLRHLDLSRNMFGAIYPSIITILPNLIDLDISNNNLLTLSNDALFLEILLHPSLEVLNMENQGVGYQVNWMGGGTNDQFPGGLGTKQVARTFGYSSIIKKVLSCINKNSFGNFTSLFNDSHLFCATIRCIGQMSAHMLKGIPCEAFGRIEDCFDSSCPYFIRFPVVKKLKQFIASNLNWIDRPTPRMTQNLCMIDSPLQNISFGQNGNWIKNTFFYDMFENITFTSPLKLLEEFNLSKNQLRSIPNGVLKNLYALDLSENYIQPSNVSICQSYPNLKYLSLASNNLSTLHSDWISSCKYLQDINLSKNSLNLTKNPISIAHSLQLKSINLNQNQLDTLPVSFTHQLDEIVKHQSADNINELQVTFHDNNLLCQCNPDTMAFLTWFQSTNVGMPAKGSYSCSTSQGQVFLIGINIDEFKKTCFPSNTKLIAESVLVTIGIIVFIFLLVALHRYRWRLQYSVIKSYNLCSKSNRDDQSGFQEDVYDNTSLKYDAFISYCAEDRFWVHDCLLKTLESDQYGLKLCIHYRDFPLGEDISSVIVRSIRESRKLIIVLSETSIGRPWCQFEFQVALSEAVRRDIKLVVIKLGQLGSEELDGSVAWVLDNHTFLEWHENKNAQKVFWFKLLRHIYGDTEGYCCFPGSRQLDSDDVAAFAELDDEKQLLLN